MVPTKAMTPHVPISAGEIIEDVLCCAEIGITMVHLHARDQDGLPTYKAEVYGRLIEGIRRYAPQLVICVSLSGRNVQDFAKRAEPLGLQGLQKPDMGSLTLSSLNFTGQASVNEPETIKMLAHDMLKRGIVPELEICDLGMFNYASYLIEKALLQPPYYANVFLGNIASAQLDLLHAGMLLRDLPEGTRWSLGGLGDAQLPANALALAMGGGVRVGLEDSIYTDRGRRTLATNQDLVRRMHALSRLHGREIMTPLEFRDIMAMPLGGRA